MDLHNCVVGVDVDEVCAHTLEVWLRRYNRAYADSLVIADITDWDLRKFVRPECGAKIFDILTEKDFYEEVAPMEGFAEGVKSLRDANATVVYVSSCVPRTLDQKMEWLSIHDPNMKWQDVILCYHKNLLRLDVLIDDAPKNLNDAPRGTSTVRFRMPYNTGVAATEHVSNWDNILDVVEDAIQFRYVRYTEAET
jgi:5'-nucleotidase